MIFRNKMITIDDVEYFCSVPDFGLNQLGSSDRINAMLEWLIANYGEPGKTEDSRWNIHKQFACFKNDEDRLRFVLTWANT